MHPRFAALVFYGLFLAGAVLLMIFSYQLSQTGKYLPTQLLGKPLPEFNLPVLSYPNVRFTKQALPAQIVLLNIWASWCHACYAEHAVLTMIKNRYAIPIYGINYRDNPAAAKKWLQNLGNPYILIALDSDGTTKQQLQLYGTPETLIIDQYGMIRYIYVGALTEASWKVFLLPVINQLLSTKKAMHKI